MMVHGHSVSLRLRTSLTLLQDFRVIFAQTFSGTNPENPESVGWASVCNLPILFLNPNKIEGILILMGKQGP